MYFSYNNVAFIDFMYWVPLMFRLGNILSGL